MVVEPDIQVKLVVNTATPKAHVRDTKLSQQSEPDAQVSRRLFLAKAAHRRERQTRFIVFKCELHNRPLFATAGLAIGLNALGFGGFLGCVLTVHA